MEETVIEKQRMIEIKAMLQNMEAIVEKERNTTPFNPLPHFTLHKVLSQEAPHFYTDQELAQIEDINQNYFQVNNRNRGHSSGEGSMSSEERKVKPKPAKKKIVPPKLPILVENKIKELNGRDIKYVMHKELFPTDLDKEQGRLSLPVELDYLNEREKAALEKRDKKGNLVGLEVVVLDPYFRDFSMSLRKWNMRKHSVYNLVKNWKLVLSTNKFKKNQKLNIWSFRDIKDKLHFVLDDKVNSEGSEELNNPDDKKVSSEESEEPNNSVSIHETSEANSYAVNLDM
ncbi:B3 domain protein [Trifolium repens]|nr:B3 domain protein [Trifolium repens]